MEKNIPFEKLSKRKQRELNTKMRGSWYGLSPVTRRPDNPKAYNRQKARKWSDDSITVPFAISAPGEQCPLYSNISTEIGHQPAPVSDKMDAIGRGDRPLIAPVYHAGGFVERYARY